MFQERIQESEDMLSIVPPIKLKLYFAGLAQTVITKHKRLETDTERVITETFDYDHQNRLLVHKHQVDANPTEILTQNTYNELSQLESKKVGGIAAGSALQQMDYKYNIRGWMTKINDPSNLNGRLFGYEIKYHNPVSSAKSPGKFNGNIAEIGWKNSSEDILKRYNYEYDPLNRLKNGFYSEPNATNPANGNFDEYLTYDLNGNISTLQRKATPVSGQTPALVDNLEYKYTGNRLNQVIESAMNDTGYEGGNNIIDYDVNGNIINMKDKGMNTIGYNHLNLPNAFTISNANPIIGQPFNANLMYLYRADGTKLRKTYSTRPPRGSARTSMTDYLDGFQYSYREGGGICLTCRTESAFEEQAYGNLGKTFPNIGDPPAWKLDFVPTSEGFYSFTENRYIYQYKDHLGNTRVSFAKDSAGVLEITDTNNYYPFGLNHISGMFGTSNFGGLYSYKYNGKELQETGMYDYGARMYMPDLGRWGVVDPLAETSRRWSPYAYAYNNPMRFIDPDGMQNKDITFGKNISAETQNKIVSDLEQETGLKLSIGDNGKLSYTEPSDAGGSKTARDMIKGAIDNHRTVYSIDSDNSRGSSISSEPTVKAEWIGNEYGFTSYFDLNINTNQIDAFISGTSEALNPLTMGYGMTTLHEVSHKYNNLIDGIIGDDGRELSATSIYGMQGDNEKKVINVIRTELDNSKGFKLPFGQRKSYSPMDSGGFNFSAFSSEAYSKGPLKVDPKKDLYIKTPQR
ncbi:RHS repeat domain-containing protein [Chryseobacterium sp. G0162]|uniref:RHS repeat domain-containing protein n=1 Tax=Chryseobacterium sp. G0162 TaxID=2487063 RepID=UPI001E2ECC1B|nr:RHS repeat-associated core domain-containing protein [Chryseobacterium sp. G0162]